VLAEQAHHHHHEHHKSDHHPHHKHDKHKSGEQPEQPQQPEESQQREQSEQREQPQQKDWQKWIPEPYRHYSHHSGQQNEQTQQLATVSLVSPPLPYSSLPASSSSSSDPPALAHHRGDDSDSIHRGVSTIIVKGDNTRIYGPQAEQPNQSSPDFSRFIRLLDGTERKRNENGDNQDADDKDLIEYFKAYGQGSEDENFESSKSTPIELNDERDQIQSSPSSNDLELKDQSSQRDTHFIESSVSADRAGLTSLSGSIEVVVYLGVGGLFLVCIAALLVWMRKNTKREQGNESERQTLRGDQTALYNSAEVDPIDDTLYRV
jgi:hypothetical protein